MIGWLAEQSFALASGCYHRYWDRRGGWRAAVPVISVGNLTVGGNGKTPLVIALLKLVHQEFPALQASNAVAVLSRGYGRTSRQLHVVEESSTWREAGDEPLLIKRSCPSALVISHAKRTESARFAVERLGARLILLDDGYQHRALARDTDRHVLDSESPLGNGQLLPRGRLREPESAIARATILIALGQGRAVDEFGAKFGKPVVYAAPIPLPADWVTALPRPVFLLTGIARPERVARDLRSAGITIAGHRSFRDHHRFTPEELRAVILEAKRTGSSAVVTTAKDMVRIPALDGDLPICAVPHEVEIRQADKLLLLVSTCLGIPIASHR